MARFNFCGPTYQALSPNVNAAWAINLYPENQPPDSRSAVTLEPTDGLAIFATLPDSIAVSGLYSFIGRTFATGILATTGVVHLYEILSNGAVNDLGALTAANGTASLPCRFAANPTQLAIVVAASTLGKVYILTLGTNVITTVALSSGLAADIAYLDGFFVASQVGNNSISVSAIEDGTTWPALNVAVVSEFPDRIVSMVVSQRTLGLLGEKGSVPYYNSGGLFPFIPVPGAYIEHGSAARFGTSKLDNTILWLGGNVDEGTLIAYRLNGYTPQRISDHAIETIWQSYATGADAITYAYQSRGHKFWVIYFPTANATWVYDIATGQWHQRGSWNRQAGVFSAHKSQCHTFNFGQHLVGDPFSGNIYSMSVENVTDNAAPIRRVRRAPCIAKEHDYEFHEQLEVLAEMGQPSQIQTQSTDPIGINLLDANGVLWTATIADGGAGSTALAAPGQVPTPGTIILADSVNAGVYWQIGVSITGVLTPTQVFSGLPTKYPPKMVYPMATTPGFFSSGLVVNAGVIASTGPGQPVYRAPQLEMRFSDDGGHNWSNMQSVGLGLTGEFTARALWRRLGKSRNRIYEIACADPISLRLIDAYTNADPGNKPQERLSDQMRKMA